MPGLKATHNLGERALCVDGRSGATATEEPLASVKTYPMPLCLSFLIWTVRMRGFPVFIEYLENYRGGVLYNLDLLYIRISKS